MNPYQIAGIVAGCLLVFVGVVALLVMQGVPVMLAFLCVYVVALLSMLAMQRRAQSCDAAEEDELERHDVRAGRADSRCDAPPSGVDPTRIAPAVGIAPLRAVVEHVTVRY